MCIHRSKETASTHAHHKLSNTRAQKSLWYTFVRPTHTSVLEEKHTFTCSHRYVHRYPERSMHTFQNTHTHTLRATRQLMPICKKQTGADWHWGWRLGSYKPPPLTNQNILPSRQPLQQGAGLSKHWGGEDDPQLVLCRPLRGLSSNGFPEPGQGTEQKGALVESTHQPITVTERH